MVRAAYDFTLFIPWTSAYPPGERERRMWRDRLSAPVFDGAAEELPAYPRFWFAESDAIQPPVTLWESLYDDRTATVPYSQHLPDLHAVCARPGGRARADDGAGDGARRPGRHRGDVTHEIMIGIPLEMAEFRA